MGCLNADIKSMNTGLSYEIKYLIYDNSIL